MNWKKQIIALAIFAALLVTVNLTMAGSGIFVNSVIPDTKVAVKPLDGHYEGTTSQGWNITMDVASGQIQTIDFFITTCNGGTWGFNFWGATFYGNSFTYSYNIIQDPSGLPSGLEPMSSYGIFGFGSFDTQTHAKGGIWNIMPYFTGVGFKTNSCFDNSITYDVKYVGPITVKDTPHSPYVTIKVR